ncbi:hypothetical protein QTN25_007412 [Entamoeba marina]
MSVDTVTTNTQKFEHNLTVLLEQPRIKTLQSLYLNEQFDLFFQVLLETNLQDNIEQLTQIICSPSPVNQNNISYYFNMILTSSVDIKQFLVLLQRVAYSTKQPKIQHIELLKLFHKAFHQASSASLLFHEHFNDLQKVITTPPQSDWAQVQPYPAVHIDGTCLICKNSLFDGQQVSIYPCGHGIHASCSDSFNDASVMCRTCLSKSTYPLYHKETTEYK